MTVHVTILTNPAQPQYISIEDAQSSKVSLTVILFKKWFYLRGVREGSTDVTVT